MIMEIYAGFNNRITGFSPYYKKCLAAVANIVVVICLTSAPVALFGQKGTQPDTTKVKVKDAMDVLRDLFNVQPKPEAQKAKTTTALLPVIGYNPSFGGVIGANVSIGKQFGDPANTNYSVYTLGLINSTKGIFTLQARHNVFRPENKFNFQGNWQFSLYGLIDYGLGTGRPNCTSGFVVGDYPVTAADSSYPIRYKYVRLLERAYHKIGKHTYAGAGVSFDIYNDIDDIALTSETSTPHLKYSLAHDFDTSHYSANGFMLAFQYNSREHPIRAYGGIYFETYVRFNQTWMGSTRNSIQWYYDFRKYWSLSKRNPDHVLALWTWASYLLSGELPYLELPYTGSDTYNRSGRGYTIGYFRGPSYAYFETEYRYPITRNKLLSGVVFLNLQTAGDAIDKNVYQDYNFGVGAGLRILFQKKSRSAICVDFSHGQCGSNGIFFGLNEVF